MKGIVGGYLLRGVQDVMDIIRQLPLLAKQACPKAAIAVFTTAFAWFVSFLHQSLQKKLSSKKLLKGGS